MVAKRDIKASKFGFISAYRARLGGSSASLLRARDLEQWYRSLSTQGEIPARPSFVHAI
jgi:hypothetical protein